MSFIGRRGGRASVLAAGLLFAVVLASSEASAQGVFCPPNPGVANGGVGSPFALNSGRCTNGNAGTGAFSGAALGSQSLSDLASGSTEATNRAAAGAIGQRREAEQFSCPAGTVRIGGVCRAAPQAQTRRDSQVPSRTRIPASVRARSEAMGPVRQRTETRLVKRGGKMVRVRVAVTEPADQFVAVPAFVQAEQGMRIGTFAQGFGDYEERRGNSSSTLLYLQPDPTTGVVGGGPAVINPLRIVSKSNATSYGAIGGIDFTTRGLLGPEDGLMFGILGGYLESEVKISSRILSSNPTLANNGSSSVTARTSGASIGGFATYFNGPFSVDTMYKADFLDLNERFVDNQAYSATFNYISPGVSTINTPQNALVAGQGKTSLVNHSIVLNANYRIPMAGGYWVEPTAGLQARWVDYASSAAQLGLANGHLFRLQAGARLGWDFEYAGMKITPILTGLVYSDVSVRGGFVDYGNAGAFGATSSSLGVAGTSVINIRQERLVRGQGILTVVADMGNGWSAFLQGDVRGGKDLFGAGGKGGIRYQW